MSKVFQFGETVPGYEIPVLNEREIRAGAGILFVLMFVAILTVVMREDFTLLKYAINIFLADILIRVVINPRYAPSLIMGRWIVRNQTPSTSARRRRSLRGSSASCWPPSCSRCRS